ncbi:MAG TPA: YceI family protein [Gaiellaceae bacterium]|nr:YceI family protein [Gaiellaceae bacterium]
MSTIEQTEQGIPTGTWRADTVHSRVAFEVPYAVATFSGEVPDFEAALADGKLTGAARIASIQVKEENLQAHLLSPEFFDAERHPEVSFESNSITRDGDSVTVDGTITIKGITKPATLTGLATGPAIDHFGAHRFGLTLSTTIDRTEFGMKWNMPLPNGEPALSNEVTLKADLTLVEQQAEA